MEHDIFHESVEVEIEEHHFFERTEKKLKNFK